MKMRKSKAGPFFCESDCNNPGWEMMPTHDPTVLDAARYAVNTIQHRSNCIGTCFLSEILLAKSKVSHLNDLVIPFDILFFFTFYTFFFLFF